MSEPSLADVVHEAVEMAKAADGQIDPAAIMAKHGTHRCIGGDYVSSRSAVYMDPPCEPYLLAEALMRVAALLGDPPEPVYDPDNPNCPGSFEGFASGSRSAHRTVGTHRAWSDAGEWCYPDQPCELCEPRIEPAALRAALGQPLR